MIWNADNGDGTYSNPVLYTDYSDPDAIRVGEDYYMISSSFCNAPAIPVLHSRDLVNWEITGYVLERIPGERYDEPVHGCGVWAPAIRYHEGWFYVCFPMPDEGIFMCRAKDPAGKWSEPVNIRPGAGWIDPCPFWDDDGKAYLVTGVAKSRIGYKSVLNISPMSSDGLSLTGPERRVFDGNENDQVTIEGPKLYKRNGYYYIFAPAGGVKTGWQTVLRSKNIYGPYEYRVVMKRGDTCVNGPHQGAWVDTPGGEDYFLHFQDVYAAGRIVHLQPMVWRDDWPVIGREEEGRQWGEPVSTWKKPAAAENSLCEPVTSDDFSDGKLNMAWQWNANPSDGQCSFEKEGLRLFARPLSGAYGDAPGLLLQKWPAPEFICDTRMDLSMLGEGDEAGVISLGMEYGLISFVRQGDSILVRTVKGKQYFGPVLVERTEEEVAEKGGIDSFRVTVRYRVERIGERDLGKEGKGYPLERVTLEYDAGDGKYVTALSMDAVPGRWVGVKNGPFCLGRGGGSVLIRSVQYRR